MNQGFVQTDEGMGAARVPDSPLGWITVVADPDMRVNIFELVVADHIIAICNHLQHHHVFAMGKHESRFFSRRRVIGTI